MDQKKTLGEGSTAPLVTIGIPVYKRLEFLPHVLKIVASQDYPNLEVLVSDNGGNGSVVHDIIRNNYPRPARVRRNASTVPMSIHFNQMIHEAAGEYFLLLADDDEITPNYISDLVRLMERTPQASVAFGVQESIDEAGTLIRRSSESVPEILSGGDFIRAAWETHECKFESFSTFLARTAKLKACGGYPHLWKGSGHDDALVVKLCLDNFVALSSRCAFRKRLYQTSYGNAQDIDDLARGVRDLLHFFDTDPVLTDFGLRNPSAWRNSKRVLVNMAWRTYYYRWVSTYRERLPLFQWVKAGTKMPFILDYYKAAMRAGLAVVGSAAYDRIRQGMDFFRNSGRSQDFN